MFVDADQHRYWLVVARKYARPGIEPADVLQEACLAAMKARRTDLHSPADQRYFRGIIRKTAWQMIRSATRRARHERAALVDSTPVGNPPAASAAPDFSALPPSLQAVASLVMANLDRDEIRSALGISDDALRRRLADLRRYVERHEIDPEAVVAALHARQQLLPDEIGLVRRALLHWIGRRPGEAAVGTVDPDGHLIAATGKSSNPLTTPHRPATEG